MTLLNRNAHSRRARTWLMLVGSGLVFTLLVVPPLSGQPAAAAVPAAAPGVPDPNAPAAQAPSTPSGRLGAAEVSIVGGNVASARERALSEALKQAVDQAIVSMSPDPHLAQPKTVVQVLGRARSYVRRYRTLEEGERGKGMYGIRVEAEIEEGALLRAFDKAPTAGGMPSATSTPPSAPSYLLVGAGAPEAVDAASRAFVTAGARVLLAAPADALDPSKAVDAAARAGVATVAFISGSVTAEGKVRGPATEAVSCSFGVRVLTAGTGLPVADETETVRAFGERADTAKSNCLQRAAAAVVPRVVPAASARVSPDIRTIVLDAEVVQPAAVPAIVKQVRALGSVSAIEVRRITATRVELWVRSRLAAAAFAAALSRDTGAPIEFSGGEVTGDLVRVIARLREVTVPAAVLPPGAVSPNGVPAAAVGGAPPSATRPAPAPQP